MKSLTQKRRVKQMKKESGMKRRIKKLGSFAIMLIAVIAITGMAYAGVH